jgi:alginate O-acetyltransferase complex protein AlgI
MVAMRFAALPEEVSTALTHQRALTLALGALVVLVPGSFVMGKLVEDGRTRAAGIARFGYTAIASPYAAMVVAAGTFSPFLYFQF